MNINDIRHAQQEVAMVAEKYGLSVPALASLLAETDEIRGLLGPVDLEAGLQRVLSTYLAALSFTAERIVDPGERLVVDRFLGQAIEVLAGQLEAAPRQSN